MQAPSVGGTEKVFLKTGDKKGVGITVSAPFFILKTRSPVGARSDLSNK